VFRIGGICMEDMDIKFRAYVDDKMVYYEDSNFLIAFNGLVLNTTLIKSYERKWVGDFGIAGWGITHNEPRVLMQSTRVPDCEGKEAYEDDILKGPSYRLDADSTQYGVVKRENDTCNLYVEWNFQRTYDGETYWDKNVLPLRKIKELQVVDNVWENKELLKGDKNE
jgi:uncharacterized phage protein (TIGR01671 family)